MTPRDRPCGPSGRRQVAGDAVHRQGLPTPSDGPHGRPSRRISKAFGQRCARLAMPRIATPHAPSRKPWKAVPRGHYHRSLALVLLRPFPQRAGVRGARLQIVKFAIASAQGNQRAVAAALDNAALVEEDDLVRMHE